MTALDRFDPFERRITEAIDEIAAARPPAYLDDILRQTARRAQRPRWTFPERWLPMDTALSRPTVLGRLPLRRLLVLALLVALAAAALAFYVGSQKQLPPPIGPAGKGQITFGVNGDIYVRDTVTGQSRLLLGGPSDQGGVVSSPDGQLIAYDNVVDGVDHAWVAGIDGSKPHQVLDQPFTGGTFQWAYDSKSAVAITDSAGYHQLWIAPADGSGARELVFERKFPYQATWDPTRPGALLVAMTDVDQNSGMDLYFVDAASGSVLSKIDMTGANLYGPGYEFSGLAFSPDGSTIAYNSVETEAAGEHFWVRLIDRDGANDRAVALPAGVPALYSQAWPVFSPDGKWIALESWVGQPGFGTRQLALADPTGSSPTRRLGPTAPEHSIVKIWAPDGTSVLIHVDTIDDMYLIDPISGESTPVPWNSDFPDWQRVALP
jgi:Tol biopolymer transport system component